MTIITTQLINTHYTLRTNAVKQVELYDHYKLRSKYIFMAISENYKKSQVRLPVNITK